MNRLLFFLFLTPTLSFAQDAPKRANTIIIKGIDRQAVKIMLVKEGFTAVERDSSFIETLPRQYKQLENGSLKMEFSFKDSAIFLQGLFNGVANNAIANPYGNRWKHAVRTSLYGNSLEAFKIMEAFAHSSGGQISYAKQ